MAWLIFFILWIVLLWLYKYSERHRQLRVQAMQKDSQSSYSRMKKDFDDSMELFNSATDFKTRLLHIDRAIDALKRMEELVPGKAHTAEKLPQLVSLKQALTYSDIKEQYENAMNKAKDAKLLIAKVNYATTAQSVLNEGLKLGIEEKTLAKEIEEANNFIHRIQYDEYMAKAKKEEEKGNTKRAIDQYQVALYFLKSSIMDEEIQNSLMKEIDAKIERLYEKGVH